MRNCRSKARVSNAERLCARLQRAALTAQRESDAAVIRAEARTVEIGAGKNRSSLCPGNACSDQAAIAESFCTCLPELGARSPQQRRIMTSCLCLFVLSPGPAPSRPLSLSLSVSLSLSLSRSSFHSTDWLVSRVAHPERLATRVAEDPH